MEENNRTQDCIQFLKLLRERGKGFAEFHISINILEKEASEKGLDEKAIKIIMDILINSDLNAASAISLIRCMIPKSKITDDDAKQFIVWFFSMKSLVTILSTALQWLIGCWEYELINRNSIYMFYDVFFCVMLKHERLEARLAQLIYLMTKPQDVTRRQVLRLLNLKNNSKKNTKHIVALLSLFKSYKPEFVPEAVQAISVQSVWRPIMKDLQRYFEDARDRIIVQEAHKASEFHYTWNTFNVHTIGKKQEEPLVPSVGYFNIGSSIFEQKTEKSIFDISNLAQLGKYHSIIKLPSTATSLLANDIGYHLLLYSDIEYQQRFMHNLYYTLWKSFIFDNFRYSNKEMNKLLDMTSEFCNYMQHGISIVNYFANEYLHCNNDEYLLKLLPLLEWSCVSTPELEDYVFYHLKLLFYSSSLQIKCKIIRVMKNLLLNLSVINDDSFNGKTFPFLNKSFPDDIEEKVMLIENFSRDLVTSALNIHFYDSRIISEALSFYEQINILEKHKKSSFIILAPPSVIYGSFVNRNCVLLSRVCALLMQYRRYFKDDRNHHFEESKILITYAEDLVSALWYGNCFSNRFANNRYFLRTLSEYIIKNSAAYKIDISLNIQHHYAVLPFIYAIRMNGVQVNTKFDANNIALRFYNYVSQFVAAFLEH